jgi:hypothetical protein
MAKSNKRNAQMLLAETRRRVEAETKLGIAQGLLDGIDRTPAPVPAPAAAPVTSPAPAAPHPGRTAYENACKLSAVNPALAASELLAHQAQISEWQAAGSP